MHQSILLEVLIALSRVIRFGEESREETNDG